MGLVHRAPPHYRVILRHAPARWFPLMTAGLARPLGASGVDVVRR